MAFHIIVCVKQVPDGTKVKIDKKTGSLLREGVPGILNPCDAHGLEAALTIKDKLKDVEVTALTMGPGQAVDMLWECLFMGADKAVLLSDKALAESDTAATAYALSCAVKKLGGADLVIAGREAIDGETAQVGPELAELLQVDQVTAVTAMEFAQDKKYIVCDKQMDGMIETVEVKLPCVLTVTEELNDPRLMYLPRILDEEKNVLQWDCKDAGVDTGEVGFEASPTHVVDSFVPESSRQGMVIESDDAEEMAGRLLAELKQIHAI